ncbi:MULTISPECIES: dihydrodipicolinate synthase family protein [Sphingobacterium]|jgi:1-pyrroline-4-hydroxy-2-carboxylate deaminase|uniref:Dihydrodipicolinate synthase family protein n=3 Tax=Sphingobacterium TaxID=28453 RepID=A0ACD5C6J6_9SPHI|nr:MULTISPECIES: dihydrodipicolinate synthase family protein [Sphingobacterium]HAE66828.1 dihydrodipicolinate synthase family protein [Sphingobacterium sp.]MDF2849426.1 dihydrodipicolinate synthase family protein [Sphingobacterium multivorum]OFV10113.1 dihydrodipicolinate synthase family protein [Sphingobacterium sp. HMSC13C05]QQT45078.1 dihydrodipicolinate synthase family protein [Sphingobacterium multivorum]QQT62267.1 dihydrodipicolinate synthase family protein [Sphingobacterium multivorum]
MAQFKWEGIYPAMLSPFDENGNLDFDMFGKNIEAQLDGGVHGLIIAGSLGEASVLTTEEKYDLLTYALKLVGGRVPVLLNIAENTTAAAIKVAQTSEELGADGLMLLPPMRYRADDREAVAYFRAVAQSTKLPILIYNNPVDYSTYVSLDMFEELLLEPNIQAVKESTRDLTNITRLKNRFGDRLKIMAGVDTLGLESLMLGADGLVAGLVDAFPRETVVMYDLVKAGEYKKAVEIYRWFMPLLELDIHPKLVQYIKLAATAEGISTPYTRAPRLPLIGEEEQRVKKIIADSIATRPQL